MKILLANYSYCHIDNIEFYEDEEELYDIDVEEDHSFLLEGGYVVHNSAGGSAKQGRNNRFQAILPLRGKVLNVEKSTINKAMENKELRSLISALNVTPQANGQVPDADDIRFKSVIVMCHTGDTKIPLLNGTSISIQEMAESSQESFWVYSADPISGKMKPGLAYLPRKTGETKELIEIEFDDGSVNRCTLNHKWIRKNGETVLAKDLKADDSLLSIHRRINKNGYEEIFDPSLNRKNKWISTHTLVAKDVFSEYENVCKKECEQNDKKTYPVIHHRDFNKQNNEPINLQSEFNKNKSKNTMRFENAVSRWSKDELIEEAKHYNRSIVSVKHITLDKPVPVYNITVAGWHNYMLENGVVSQNCDADPDGAHIACLLITFFYKFMRTLIERGHIKVAQPPLYRIRKGKNVFYLHDDEELDEFLEKQKSKDGFEINRFKGLGEMNPDQLAETVLDPKSRNLVQISIEDAEQAAKTIEALFGKEVEGRKKFLFKDLNLTTESTIL